MPPRFSRLLSSKPFEIKSSDKSYFIHGDILTAEQSESLRHTATGEVADEIDLSNWDSDIVGLFAEFLYAGNYFLESTLEEEGEEEEDDDEDEGTRRCDSVNTPDTVQSLEDQERARGTNEPLVHAKVYALAQFKNIKTLQAMALERLSTALEGNNRRVLAAAEINELLGYICSHTDSLTNPDEPVRDLVSKFAANNIEKLMGGREIGLLLSKGGNLTVELMEKVAERLCDMSCDAAKKRLDLEREVQSWKSRAEASEERVWRLEDINAKMWESETVNEAKIQQLEVANAEKEQKLEFANAMGETQHLENIWTNAEGEQQGEGEQQRRWEQQERGEQQGGIPSEKWELGDKDWRIRHLTSAHGEKVRELQVAKTQLSALKDKVESLEYKNKWLEAVNAEKLRKPEDTDANAKMWESEARLEAKLGWFMASCPEKAQVYENLFPGL